MYKIINPYDQLFYFLFFLILFRFFIFSNAIDDGVQCIYEDRMKFGRK